MFYFGKKKSKELVGVNLHEYEVILNNLIELLNSVNLGFHAQILQKLVEFLQKKEVNQFIKSINTIDIWEGSGAVWEVYIDDVNKNRRFQMEIIRLIDLMEKTRIMGYGVSPIGKFFRKELAKMKDK